MSYAMLTATQMQELRSIATSGQSGARVLYYTKLSEFGIEYGGLARSVVLEDQLAGRVANNYFMRVAEREGVSVSDEQWGKIGDALMMADLEARLATQKDLGFGYAYYTDIDYRAIRGYHEYVFSTLGGTVPAGEGVSIEAWTAYAPGEVLGDKAWDMMLDDNAVVQAGMSMAVFSEMFAASFLSAENRELIAAWLKDATAAYVAQVTTDASPLAFSLDANHNYLVMGTRGGDQIVVDETAAGYKKIMILGLNGDDDILVPSRGGLIDAGGGNDTIRFQEAKYLPDTKIVGGEGYDTVDFSNIERSVDEVKLAARGEQDTIGDDVKLDSVESIIGNGQGTEFIFLGSPAATSIESIDAGDGIYYTDTLTLSDVNEGMLVNLPDNAMFGHTSGHRTTVKNFEDVNGTRYDDTIIGNDGQNTLHGNGGSDELQGGGERDSLYGDGGKDRLFGGSGNDYLDGGSEDDYLDGGNDADHLNGGAGDDRLMGGDGDDYLSCDSGRDTATGGAGMDRFSVIDGACLIITDYNVREDTLLTDSSLREDRYDSSEGLVLAYEDGSRFILQNVTLDQYEHPYG